MAVTALPAPPGRCASAAPGSCLAAAPWAASACTLGSCLRQRQRLAHANCSAAGTLAVIVLPCMAAYLYPGAGYRATCCTNLFLLSGAQPTPHANPLRAPLSVFIVACPAYAERVSSGLRLPAPQRPQAPLWSVRAVCLPGGRARWCSWPPWAVAFAFPFWWVQPVCSLAAGGAVLAVRCLFPASGAPRPAIRCGSVPVSLRAGCHSTTIEFPAVRQGRRARRPCGRRADYSRSKKKAFAKAHAVLYWPHRNFQNLVYASHREPLWCSAWAAGACAGRAAASPPSRGIRPAGSGSGSPQISWSRLPQRPLSVSRPVKGSLRPSAPDGP